MWWSIICVGVTKQALNSLSPRQSRRHFADDIFKCIFLNARISLKILLKFVPKIRINNIRALVQIMAWRWPGDKPLSEPMMASLLTHICITQWVKAINGHRKGEFHQQKACAKPCTCFPMSTLIGQSYMTCLKHVMLKHGNVKFW